MDANAVSHSDARFFLSIKPESHSEDAGHAHRQAAVSVAQCRLNLLDHVETLHHQITARMDLIERELDGNTHRYRTGFKFIFPL